LLRRIYAYAIKMTHGPNIAFHPATADRWRDLVKLFGERGACGGCWCMVWRLPGKQWRANKGEGNRRALHKLVKRDHAPGVLMYVDGEPAGWCAVAPRQEYVILANSRVLAPVDDKPVWSVSCFFVARPFRRKGLALPLLKAAAEYAHSQGATIVEGYPNELSKGEPDAFIWRGVASTFRKAGFKEAAKRSPKRPIMRKTFAGRTQKKKA